MRESAFFDELSECDEHVKAEQDLLRVHIHHRGVDVLSYQLCQLEDDPLHPLGRVLL